MDPPQPDTDPNSLPFTTKDSISLESDAVCLKCGDTVCEFNIWCYRFRPQKRQRKAKPEDAGPGKEEEQLPKRSNEGTSSGSGDGDTEELIVAIKSEWVCHK